VTFAARFFSPFFVMAVLVTAIHVFLVGKQGVDARDKPAHDGERRGRRPRVLRYFGSPDENARDGVAVRRNLA
jgi:hypothetical protein